MTMFVDPPTWWFRGRNWSHLISDHSIEELHQFAREAGVRYLSFGYDHYDVPEDLFARVVDLGAQVVGPREIVRTLRSSGLRTTLGKSDKRWARAEPEVRRSVWADQQLDDLVANVARVVGSSVNGVEVLCRPAELAVVAAGPLAPQAVDVAAVQTLATSPAEVRVDDVAVFVTQERDRWALEIVARR